MEERRERETSSNSCSTEERSRGRETTDGKTGNFFTMKTPSTYTNRNNLIFFVLCFLSYDIFLLLLPFFARSARCLLLLLLCLIWKPSSNNNNIEETSYISILISSLLLISSILFLLFFFLYSTIRNLPLSSFTASFLAWWWPERATERATKSNQSWKFNYTIDII